ncbi:hypothetical protein B4589_001945 [Halolamina sp. CBA1230]|uniref:BGTF surface domain-containing protein n=1 Tax=Halolamina sp. CBA1230 TaxID=1853690 RepID=UPI0009A18282|nr:BGTF surface domain-containing protein [Halolamina sp. CBA1230]QKY19197.1 hypothetical protein B4589_001945 [Halolamina sp. CBA1230]
MGSPRGVAAVIALLLAAALLSPAGAATGADPAVTIDYDGEAVTVANAETQIVSGSAELAPGTSISVRIRSTGDTQPRFLQSKTVTVDRNGTWAAAFDFSEQSPGDTFEVTVRTDAGELTADGEVVACETDCEDDEPEPVETVRIDTTDGNVVVNDTASQVVSGSALAPTGTEVSLRLRSTDSEIRFFKAATAVVTDDGSWASAFNFSTIPPGSAFSVEATIDGGYVAETEGEVVDCESDCRDDPPTDTPTPIPDATPEPTATPAATSVEFSRNVVHVRQGTTARMELAFDDTDTTDLVIGGQSAGYTLEATVRDADGDGEATVRFDTAAAGDGGSPLGVSDGDELTLESETDLGSDLDPGDYDLRLLPEDRGEASDIGSLYVAEPGTATPQGDTPTAAPTLTGSPTNGGDVPVEIAVSGALVLGGGGLALLLRRG